MSFTRNIRSRFESKRAARVLHRAIQTAGSPSMRDELLIASQRAGLR